MPGREGGGGGGGGGSLPAWQGPRHAHVPGPNLFRQEQNSPADACGGVGADGVLAPASPVPAAGAGIRRRNGSRACLMDWAMDVVTRCSNASSSALTSGLRGAS